MLLTSCLPAWSLWPLAIAGLIIGMFLLTKSAEIFVEGAVALACRLAIPPLIIGFVIVGFGTSAPEMIVSVLAAAQGAPVLALGNAYGSNITNVLLILGVCMLIAPIALHRIVLKRDIPFLLGVMGLLSAFCVGAHNGLSRLEGASLFIIFIIFLSYQICIAWKQRETATVSEEEDCECCSKQMSVSKMLASIAGGLTLLILSSQMLVYSAKWIAETVAQAVGISQSATQLIVGVTIIALGTSLPELMASVVATRKGQDDIAVGNVIGSNCFNLCIVAGLALMIQPVAGENLPNGLRYRDLFSMIISTLLLWVPALIVWARIRKQKPSPHITLGRPLGILFLILWLIYTVWVVLATN